MQQPRAYAGGPADLSAHTFSLDIGTAHPAFDGHFPGHPVLPGVVVLAEVLAGIEQHLAKPVDRILIRSAKFHAPVAPGSTLRIELVSGDGDGSAVAFTVSCDDTRVASGTLGLEATAAAATGSTA